MTLSEISDVAQAVAAVAVIISLVYLAIQTRQAARNAKAAMHENRAAAIVGHIDHMIDDKFHPVWMKGGSAAADMSDVDVGRYVLFVSGLLTIWAERYRQKQEGMLDADRWTASEGTIRTFMRAPGFRAAVTIQRARFDPAFGAVIDRILAEGRAAPVDEASAAWRAAAATERAGGTPQ